MLYTAHWSLLDPSNRIALDISSVIKLSRDDIFISALLFLSSLGSRYLVSDFTNGSSTRHFVLLLVLVCVIESAFDFKL